MSSSKTQSHSEPPLGKVPSYNMTSSVKSSVCDQEKKNKHHLLLMEIAHENVFPLIQKGWNIVIHSENLMQLFFYLRCPTSTTLVIELSIFIEGDLA
jgi:hypothetical protein